MSKLIEVECEVHLTTAKAIQIYDGTSKVWIPLSQIHDQCEDEDGNITSIFITEWLATEKGLT